LNAQRPVIHRKEPLDIRATAGTAAPIRPNDSPPSDIHRERIPNERLHGQISQLDLFWLKWR